MSIKLKLDKNIFDIDLSPWKDYIDWSPGLQYFNLAPGVSPYKLIAHLARQLPQGSLISDCGTLYGCSATALASDNYCSVHTWDIVDHIPGKTYNVASMPNVHRHLDNCNDGIRIPAAWSIERSSLIYLDIDPHDGEQESRFVTALIEYDFNGVLICDDIHLNDGMKNFWEDVALINEQTPGGRRWHTLDLTPWGHHAGTGAVVFNPDTVDLEIAVKHPKCICACGSQEAWAEGRRSVLRKDLLCLCCDTHECEAHYKKL